MLIGGEWRHALSGRTFESHDPGTGELLAILAEGDAQDVDLAELESLDNGKPKSVALAADVPLAADPFWYMAGWATVPRSRRRCRTCPTRSSMRTRRVSRSASPGRSSPRTARS